MLLYEQFVAPAATFYSKKGSLRGRNALSIIYFWTGTLAATATLWGSNLDNPNDANDNDWVQCTDVTLTNPTSGGGKFGITIGNAHFKWYRVKFLTPSGSGNLTIYVDHLAASTRV